MGGVMLGSKYGYPVGSTNYLIGLSLAGNALNGRGSMCCMFFTVLLFQRTKFGITNYQLQKNVAKYLGNQ